MKLNVDVGGLPGLSVLSAAMQRLEAGGQTSLVRQSAVARVEPIMVIDPELMYYEGMSDIAQSVLSQITALYLQVAALSSTSVDGISIAQKLEQLNPSRQALDHIGSTLNADASLYSLGVESAYAEGLPTQHRRQYFEQLSTGIESDKTGEQPAAKKDDRSTAESLFYGKEAIAATHELANLSVGKVFSVELSAHGRKETVPVSIRLIARSVRPDLFLSFFVKDHLDKTAEDRFYAWKVGRLSFVKDILLAMDAYKQYKKQRMQDTSGVSQEIGSRDANNRVSGMLTGRKSLNGLANVVVMSSTTARTIEAKMAGRFKDPRWRAERMEVLSSMILVIVDKEYDRVTFYYDSIPLGSELGLRDLKSSNKGGGPDVLEILKAYQASTVPTL